MVEGLTRRLDRARSQIDDLTGLIDAYRAEARRGRVYEVREDPLLLPDGTRLLRLVVLKPPDYLEWAFRVGEIVHNARAPLDHIASALAGPAAARDWPRPSFPLLTKKAAGKRPHGALTDKSKWLGRLDPTTLDIIEFLQPYHGHAAGLGLLSLNELWNADKHRLPLLAVVASRLEVARYTYTDSHPRVDWQEFFQFESESIVGRAYDDFASQPSADLSLTVRLRESTMADSELSVALSECVDAAREAVHLLEPVLPR
jgi:hypothetical protein